MFQIAHLLLLYMESKKTAVPGSEPRFSNCLECKHYFITWDPKFPYGCNGMHFKSARQPQLDVLESSGQICLMFEKKNRAAGPS